MCQKLGANVIRCRMCRLCADVYLHTGNEQPPLPGTDSCVSIISNNITDWMNDHFQCMKVSELLFISHAYWLSKIYDFP